MAQALEGVKVLELAQMVAGPYCTRLLADFGAEVIKIEPPGNGDAARGREPFYRSRPAPENSTLFLYLNTDKKSVALDLATPEGTTAFLELAAWADVLVEDTSPGYLQNLGLGHERLAKANSRLVITSITPFGQTGPYRDFKAYHLNVYHAGGDGYLMPHGLGYDMFPDRPPVQGGGYLADYQSGLTAAVATMAALFSPLQEGPGQQVDVSAQEAQIGVNHYTMYKLLDHGVVENRESHGFTSGGILPCKDGYVQIMILEPHEFNALMELMGHPEWEKDERFKDPVIRAKNGKELNRLIFAWSRTQEKGDLCRRGRALGLPIGIHRSPAEVLDSDQEKVREFFVEVERPDQGKVKYPGAPFKFSRTPATIRRAAPRLGEHSAEVLGRLGHSPADVAKLTEGRPETDGR